MIVVLGGLASEPPDMVMYESTPLAMPGKTGVPP